MVFKGRTLLSLYLRTAPQKAFFSLVLGVYVGLMFLMITANIEEEVEDEPVCPEAPACPTCPTCPPCKLCDEDRRKKIMEEAAFDDAEDVEDVDDCPEIPNLALTLKETPCFPFEFIMTTFDAGGIGNKMSEYASLIAVTTLTGYTPGLSQLMYDELSAAFPNMPYRPVNLTEECKALKKYIDPSKVEHFESFLQFGARRFPYIHMVNYPNAVRLFDKMYGLIKHHFTFQPEVEDAADEFFMFTIRNRPAFRNAVHIGIHIRRMGYDYHLRVTQNGTRVGLEWFYRAMALMKANLIKQKALKHTKFVFIISTDDLLWAKRSFKDCKEPILFTADYYNFVPTLNMKHLDMCIMSKCDHSIYDYGTFGFWGAYLAGGYTILAQNMGTGLNSELENIKPAHLPQWTYLDAFV